MSDVRAIWALANNIIRTSRILLNDALKPLNLTSSEANVLLLLKSEGDGLRQDDIVEGLEISKSAVSRALDSLESKRYVLRQRSIHDRRVSHVLLTEAAHKTYPGIQNAYQKLFQAASQHISDEEVAAFTDLFGRVSGNLTLARERLLPAGESGPDDELD